MQKHSVSLPSSTSAMQAGHVSGAYVALFGLFGLIGLICSGALPEPAEPGLVVGAVDGALDFVAPVLLPASAAWLLWSCVDRARQADPRLGAALLRQQAWSVAAAAVGLAAFAAAVGAGFSVLAAVFLAMVAGPAAAAALGGAFARLEEAALARWGAATGPVRLAMSVRGSREEVAAALLETASLLDPAAEDRAQ